MSEFKRTVRQFVQDMGLTKPQVLGILLGIATGLWMSDAEWHVRLSALEAAILAVFAIVSTRALVVSILRGRRLTRRWQVLCADFDMAIDLEDHAWAEACLAEMRAMYKEEFGREMMIERKEAR